MLTDNQNKINPIEITDKIREFKANNDFKNYYDQLLTLIQYYIDINDLENALQYCNELNNDINKEEYTELYKELLDKYIYIYISMQNYNRAINFSNIKKNYLNVLDNKELIRWNLELAHLYNAIDDSPQALMRLKAVLANNPDDNDKCYALCSIAKLYTESDDLKLAHDAINEAQTLANNINDTEGVEYCDYLLGMVYRLEKKYNESQTIFRKIFKKDTKLDDNTFTYLNEYLKLLVENRSYNEGVEMCEMYYDDVELSNNLKNKYDFYESYLRIVLSYNNERKKRVLLDSNEILDKMREIEKDIKNSRNYQSNILKNDELFLELKIQESKTSKEIVENINYVKFTLNSSLRTFLTDYFDSLNIKIPFDEAVVSIFDKRTNQVLGIENNEDGQKVDVYNYKQKRLYERKYNFNELNETSFKNVFLNKQKYFVIDETNNYETIDLITLKSYGELGYKYSIGFPLINSDSLFGAIIYSFTNKICVKDSTIATLELASKIFSCNIKLLLESNSVTLEKGILSSTLKNIELGTFYQLIDEKNDLYLSSELKKMIGAKNSVITEASFTEKILNSDLEKYLKKYTSIDKREPYKNTYHFEINEKSIFVQEQASPYLSIDNKLYYCGTIEKIVLSKSIIDEVDKARDLTQYQSYDKLIQFLEENRKSKFTGFVFKFDTINQLDSIHKEKGLELIYLNLRKFFNNIIYNVDNMFIVITEETKAKEALKILKDVTNNYDDVSSYTYINYPEKLIRVDDFIEVSRFIVNSGSKYIEFNNERYADYISGVTISNCVNKAIMTNDIELNKYKVSIDYEFNGYKITPNIKGVYNTECLKVCNKTLIEKLDFAMIQLINKLEGISYYVLTLDSLVNIVKHRAIELNKEVIFILNDVGEINASDFNYVLKKLSKIKAQVVITENHFKNITVNSLYYYAKVIYGFIGDVSPTNDAIMKNYKKNFYYIDSPNFKIAKEVTRD